VQEIPCDESLERALSGRTVYLWTDNGDVGRKHMDRIAAQLLKLGVDGGIVVFLSNLGLAPISLLL